MKAGDLDDLAIVALNHWWGFDDRAPVIRSLDQQIERAEAKAMLAAIECRKLEAVVAGLNREKFLETHKPPVVIGPLVSRGEIGVPCTKCGDRVKTRLGGVARCIPDCEGVAAPRRQRASRNVFVEDDPEMAAILAEFSGVDNVEEKAPRGFRVISDEEVD